MRGLEGVEKGLREYQISENALIEVIEVIEHLSNNINNITIRYQPLSISLKGTQ